MADADLVGGRFSYSAEGQDSRRPLEIDWGSNCQVLLGAATAERSWPSFQRALTVTKPCITPMLEFHCAERADRTLAVKALDTQIPFGVVTLQGSYVEEIRGKPVYCDYVNARIYVICQRSLKTGPRTLFEK